MIIGMIVAVVILFTQTFYYNYLSEVHDDQIKTEINDQQQEDVPVMKMAQDAVTSAVQVILFQALHLISEIVLVDGEEVKVEPSIDLGYISWVKVLFNVIISPNAP